MQRSLAYMFGWATLYVGMVLSSQPKALPTLLMFAAFAFLVIVVPEMTPARVRRRRRARGHCPACDYDLCHRPEAGCSECGWNRPAPITTATMPP